MDIETNMVLFLVDLKKSNLKFHKNKEEYMSFQNNNDEENENSSKD